MRVHLCEYVCTQISLKGETDLIMLLNLLNVPKNCFQILENIFL